MDSRDEIVLAWARSHYDDADRTFTAPCRAFRCLKARERLEVDMSDVERAVYEWACKHWPDVRETWEQCRDYYWREYTKLVGKAA